MGVKVSTFDVKVLFFFAQGTEGEKLKGGAQFGGKSGQGTEGEKFKAGPLGVPLGGEKFKAGPPGG